MGRGDIPLGKVILGIMIMIGADLELASQRDLQRTALKPKESSAPVHNEVQAECLRVCDRSESRLLDPEHIS